MAQGIPKSLLTRSSSSGKPGKNSTATLRKGAKVLKPRSKKANQTVNSSKIKRHFSAGIAARTEALLGERAGHLEILGKSKKAKKGKGKNGAGAGGGGGGGGATDGQAKKKGVGEGNKGGTRKFG